MPSEYEDSEGRAAIQSNVALPDQGGAKAGRARARVRPPVMPLLLAILAVGGSLLWIHMVLAMPDALHQGPPSEASLPSQLQTAEAVPKVVETILLEGDAQPIAVAVNPNDGYVYVVNIGTGTVSVIKEEETLATIDLKTVPYPATSCPDPTPYGSCLNAVGVNRVTNHIYVTEWYHDLAQIIRGTEVIDWVFAGKGPAGMVTHCTNDSVYALDKWTPGVTVIQGDQDRCFIPGAEPNAGVVDPTTGYVYIANSGSDSVAVLDGCTKIADIPVGDYPNAITYNPHNGYVYVVNSGNCPSTVSVIGGLEVIGTVPVGCSHTLLGINGYWGIEQDGSTDIIAAHPDGNIYVSNWASNTISIISDTHWLTDVVVETNPNALGIDPGTGTVYVANIGSDSVSVIAGTEVITTATVGDYPFDLAVSPTDGYVYVANRDDASISILAVPRATRLFLPLVVKPRGAPSLELTQVPPYGSFEDLQGQARGVDPNSYQVAVYIYVSGWWTKPTWDSPLTPIRSDGSWTCDITTGGTDQLATRIVAFLLPNGYNPPLMSGGQTLPPEVYENSVASAIAEREAVFREIEFSGRTWQVKASETPAGPGPNYFSDRQEDVWVDEAGRLHMNVVYRDGKWYCTEVITTEPLGFGVYTFTLASRVDVLDKNVVLGLFTWDDTAPEHEYREIDIEFSRWGEEAGDNAQYVVAPWYHTGNRHQFSMELQGEDSTHSFNWGANSIQFSSFHGHDSLPNPGDEIQSWLYTGADVPPAGEGNARINLWLLNGDPPSNGQGVEVIVEAFDFHPEAR